MKGIKGRCGEEAEEERGGGREEERRRKGERQVRDFFTALLSAVLHVYILMTIMFTCTLVVLFNM